jgi:hypothetical protein
MELSSIVFLFSWHNENNKALAQLAGMKNVPRLMPVALIEVLCECCVLVCSLLSLF